MADLLDKLKEAAKLVGIKINLPDLDGYAGKALKALQNNRKNMAKFKPRHKKALAKLSQYKTAFDKAHKDVAGCKARDERLLRTWNGLADKIVKLQRGGRGAKDVDKEIRALHENAVSVYDEMDKQVAELEKKYKKLSDKLVRGLNNLPY